MASLKSYRASENNNPYFAYCVCNMPNFFDPPCVKRNYRISESWTLTRSMIDLSDAAAACVEIAIADQLLRLNTIGRLTLSLDLMLQRVYDRTVQF